MNYVELLVGIAEIAVALAGFTGVAVALGSREDGHWHPGDRLRLGFLLEASLTAAGFSIVALILLTCPLDEPMVWAIMSASWAVFMTISLWNSRRSIKRSQDSHGDTDRIANIVTTALFLSLIGVQIANVFLWQALPAFLAAISMNVAGAAMQFSRLIRSAFHE